MCGGGAFGAICFLYDLFMDAFFPRNIFFLVNSEGFLAKYFIPGCVGRGLDLDLRIRPAAAPAPASAASGNPGFGPP